VLSVIATILMQSRQLAKGAKTLFGICEGLVALINQQVKTTYGCIYNVMSE